MAVRSTSGPFIAGRSTKEAIREAAVTLFSHKGFEQTSLREVADAVGITKASLYYHYASKLDLLLAIIEPVVDDLLAVVGSTDGVPHGPEAVREIFTRQLRTLLKHRTAGMMCMRDTVAIVNAIGDRLPDITEMHGRLVRWLAGPDPSDEAMLRANSALEVLNTALWSSDLTPAADDALISDVLLDAAFGVLRNTDARHG